MVTILYFQSKSKQNRSEKLKGVQNIAAKYGWLLQVVEGIPCVKSLATLLDFWKPAGAIVECGGTQTAINPNVFGSLPVVFFDHDPSCLPQKTFCVTHDSAATAKMAAEELLRSGIKSFAYVPFHEPRFWSEERGRAFSSIISINGYRCLHFNGCRTNSDPTRYQRELRTFLSTIPKPCALFAANDATAAEIITAASISKIKIPEELAIISVDDVQEICEHTIPTLTSVRPDFRRGGELAAILLSEQINGKPSAVESRKLTFGPLAVIRRSSTLRLPNFDPAVAEALEVIRKNACLGLSSREVLKCFVCSRRQAELRFRKATGKSILEEIHDVQLERAKQLLKEDSMPIKSIANFCGFENPNSLAKFFKAKTGLTMTAWRCPQNFVRNNCD